MNWIRRRMHLEFGPRKKSLLLTQLSKDVDFLKSLGVMDYSLLLGIHYISRGNFENIRSTTLSITHPRSAIIRSGSKRKPLKENSSRRLSLYGGADAIFPSQEFLERSLGLFTSEEGGFYATNANDQPTGDIIYYFGVIDFLSTVLPKRYPLTSVRL
jgi:1-phosphatidylinositol-4-phosphate 5-kinase